MVLKISTFLITKNKLNIYSSFSVGNIFQDIHIALVPKGKLYLIEKCQLVNVESDRIRKFCFIKSKYWFRKRLLKCVKIFRWMIGWIKHPYNAKVTAHRLLPSCKEKKITPQWRDCHHSKLVIDLSITNGQSHTVSLMWWNRNYRTSPMCYIQVKNI